MLQGLFPFLNFASVVKLSCNWNIIWEVILWSTCGNFFAVSILGWLILWLIKSDQYCWPCFERLASVLVCYKYFGVWVCGNSHFPLSVSEVFPLCSVSTDPAQQCPALPPAPGVISGTEIPILGWAEVCSEWLVKTQTCLFLLAAPRGPGHARLQPPALGCILETSCFSALWDRRTFFHSSGSCSVSKCFCGRIGSWKNVFPSNCTEQVSLVKTWKRVMDSGH